MMWDKPVDDPLFCEVNLGITTLTPACHLDCETMSSLFHLIRSPQLPRRIPC
jgi:hypothetical protein